jgi:hypothetical protein
MTEKEGKGNSELFFKCKPSDDLRGINFVLTKDEVLCTVS